jgi:hypothetical protein
MKLLIELVNHVDQSWLNLRVVAGHERVKIASIFLLDGTFGALALNLH